MFEIILSYVYAHLRYRNGEETIGAYRDELYDSISSDNVQLRLLQPQGCDNEDLSPCIGRLLSLV